MAPAPSPSPSFGPIGGAILRGVHLRKRYGSVVALADASLDVHAGECVAVMGSSGSGKSTLLHCLAGIQPPERGEVWLDRDRIDRRSESDRTDIRRTRFGFVFQSGLLLPELPAVENVALPLMLGGMTRRKAVHEADRWFQPLGIGGLQDRRPGELSGGQAQRVAIARALVVSPAVVFADEPTAALDRDTGRATMELLIAACRRAGSAAVVVTHNPEVASVCDRTVVIVDGALGVPPPRWPGSGRAVSSTTGGNAPVLSAGVFPS